MEYGGDILEGSETSKERNGFSYKGGSERNTQGIWLWSEPFVLPNKNVEGGKMCVLLMDTQGLFDGQTGQMLTTSIFGISTLLSSYQIYNIDKRLQEDNLQHLALFSEYSRVVFNGDDSQRMSLRLSTRSIQSRLSIPETSSNEITTSFLEAAAKREEEAIKKRKEEAPFQQIDFLVRDWQNFHDESNFTLSLKEMDEYRDSFFAKRNAADLRVGILSIFDSQETREQIEYCYQHFGVFLLPHPGLEVTRKTYNGSLQKVEPFFLRLIGFYVEQIFLHNLQPKLINKEVLYAEDFEAFTVAYGEMFVKANLFPKALTILGATAEVNNQNASRVALELYKASMSTKVSEEHGFVKEEELKALHEESLKEALALYKKRATMGDKEKIKLHCNVLETNIEKEHQRFVEENKARDPIAWLATYIVGFETESNDQVPATIAIIAYLVKVVLGAICGPWSDTCRTTEDFFSSLVVGFGEDHNSQALIIISIVLSNWKKLATLYMSAAKVFKTLNTATTTKK